MTLKFHENQNKAQVYGLHNLHRNLWHLFADVAYQFPDREVVVSRWQRLRWTYSELLEITEILARWLVSSGCSKGDYLIAIVGNSAEWALCFWAAVRMGMIFVPLNPNYVGTARQIESLPKKGRSVLVVLNENLAAAMEDVLRPETMARLLRICCAGPDDRQNLRFKLNWFYLPDIITLCVGQAPSLPTTEPVSGEDHLLILFTSGTTTGAPKACALTSSNIWSQTSARLSNEGLHRTLINLPLFHIFGITQALRTLRFGGRIVLPAEKFDVSATLRAIKEERCNHMPVVKAMLEAIIQESPPSAKSDTTSMRIVELGADSVSPADIHRYKEQLGLTVVQSYGMTEGAPIAGWSAADPAASGVGRVYPGANIKICSPEDRLTVFGRNEPGMLHISGPSVISSYLVTDGQADREFYDDGGIRWFITGDRALIDESNALHILGRYKDLIKRGGESICPVEAENWVREKFDMRVSS
jgi:acyl-CoA synthetase (AMP-forming)/AMP-acid ligase II